MTRKSLVGWLAVLLAGAAVVVAGFLGAGHFLAAPSQEPVKADLIFSLGGDNGGRVNGVLDLYRRGFAPLVVVGGEGVHSKTRTAYLSWQATYLVESGIPEKALLFDGRSTSSWQEAVHTLELMKAKRMGHVLVVSDPPHMRRLSWVWGKVFAGSGKTFTLVASNMEQWDPGQWWSGSPNAQYVFSEYIKLAYYLYQY